MIEVKTTLYYPHCFATKIVRNGHKKNKIQNYLCRNCGKQFQHENLYRGCQTDTKQLLIKMLVNGNGIRDIGNILAVSLGYVLRTLLRVGECIQIKPARRHYHRVQIDELYSFVGHKQKKVWILYAYCAETDEILAMTAGKRGAKQIKDRLKGLEGITVDWWCKDAWSAFKEVLPYYEHLIGKRFTKAIEGVNTSLRNTCKRLHRRTTSFSKKVRNHWFALKMVVHHRNGNLSYN